MSGSTLVLLLGFCVPLLTTFSYGYFRGMQQNAASLVVLLIQAVWGWGVYPILASTTVTNSFASIALLDWEGGLLLLGLLILLVIVGYIGYLLGKRRRQRPPEPKAVPSQAWFAQIYGGSG